MKIIHSSRVTTEEVRAEARAFFWDIQVLTYLAIHKLNRAYWRERERLLALEKTPGWWGRKYLIGGY